MGKYRTHMERSSSLEMLCKKLRMKINNFLLTRLFVVHSVLIIHTEFQKNMVRFPCICMEGEVDLIFLKLRESIKDN